MDVTMRNFLGCMFCEKYSHNATNMKEHILNHNGEKLMKCGTCDLSLINKLYLKKHLPIHMETLKRKCPDCVFCKKPFKLFVNLKTHSDIHNEGNPFMCSTC